MTAEEHLRVAAFAEGFARGADPKHANRRTVVEPLTHDDWRQGFEAGRNAAGAAREAFRRDLVGPRPDAGPPPAAELPRCNKVVRTVIRSVRYLCDGEPGHGGVCYSTLWRAA